MSSNTVFKYLLILVSALLLFAQIFHTINYPIWFDDSFFLSVAKSLANGEGYRAVFFDQNYPFHFGISSGPLVILPAAFLIFIFGNQYWVGDVSNILLIWSLLYAIFYLSQELLGQEKKWPFCLLSLISVLLFSTASYGNANTNSLVLWHLLMGEIPAALCVIISAFLLFSPKTSQRRIYLGGLFLGLAIMAKLTAGIAVALIFFSFAFKIITAKKSKKISTILTVGACTAAPFFLFELIKLINIGWRGYSELQSQIFTFYKSHGLVANQLQSKTGDLPLTPVSWNIAYLKRFFDAAYPILIPITCYIICLSLLHPNSKKAHCIWTGITLIFCFLLHTTWWILLSKSCDCYLVIALFCYFVGLALLLASIDYQRQSRLGLAVIIWLILALFDSRISEIRYLFFTGFEGNSQRLEEQLTVAKEVSNLSAHGVTMISCGNNSELEYLLPNSRNFQKCEEVLTGSLKTPVMLVNYYLDPAAAPLHVINIEANQYYAVTRAIPEEVLLKCSIGYFEGENYSLSWCR